MKTLCVAVVVLSLLRGCQPASLTCETLKKPLDTSPDFPGRWYFIAISFNGCLMSAIWSFFESSLLIDLSSTDKLNSYDGRYGIKMLGHCKNTTGSFLLQNSTIRETEQDVEIGVLLQTGCRDCIVVKTGKPTLMLFSRRINITTEEMSEFQKQAECLGLNTLKLFNTDHDRENCIPFDDRETRESPELELLVEQRLKNMFRVFNTCVKDNFLYYPRAAYEWVQQKWANLW